MKNLTEEIIPGKTNCSCSRIAAQAIQAPTNQMYE